MSVEQAPDIYDEQIKIAYQAEINKYRDGLQALTQMENRQLVRDISTWVRTKLSENQKKFLDRQGLQEDESTQKLSGQDIVVMAGFLKNPDILLQEILKGNTVAAECIGYLEWKFSPHLESVEKPKSAEAVA